MFMEFLHLPQNRESESAIAYLVAEYRRLLGGLERITGCPLEEDALRNAIRSHNENRVAAAALLDLRRTTPWALDAWENYALLHGGAALEREEHTRLLRTAFEAARRRERKPKDRVRVLVLGAFCEQPPLELVRTIEEAGCYILEDDLLQGLHWFRNPIPADGDPLSALAGHRGRTCSSNGAASSARRASCSARQSSASPRCTTKCCTRSDSRPRKSPTFTSSSRRR